MTRLTRLLDWLLGQECLLCLERHCHLAAHQRLNHSGDIDLMPCRGRNANVCVAEGCYGEACAQHEEMRR